MHFHNFKKLNDLISSGGQFFLDPPGPGMVRPCTRPLKLSDHRKSYNKQLSNVVKFTSFYGIGLSSKLDSAH